MRQCIPQFSLCRKCDKLGCNSLSPLWRINTGCGHSFHIECTLPTVSVCPVCHATLQEKMETLGKAANLAVFKPSEKTTDDENNDGDDSDVDDDGTHSNVAEDEEDDVDQDEDMINDYDDSGRGPDATIVFGLVGEIARWQHASTPSQ